MNRLKSIIIILLLLFSILPVFSKDNKDSEPASNNKNLKRGVEISFSYTKQSGFASNQFAVWIEDNNGSFIKTLYATKFTANGGWKKRATLPEWVKKSNLENMSKTEIDSITGATPKTGSLTYIWNCTDKTGSPVTNGEYRFIVEANLRGENRIVYTGIIKVGNEQNQSVAKEEFFGNIIKEKEMIESVKAVYNP